MKTVSAKLLMAADKEKEQSMRTDTNLSKTSSNPSNVDTNPSGTDVNITADNQHRCPPISSTPYHPKQEMKSAGSLISPVMTCNTTRSVREDSVKRTDADCPASESEGWSEPDRSVSLARIGLPVGENNSISSLLLKKSSGAHSGSDTDGLPAGLVPRVATRGTSDTSVSPGLTSAIYTQFLHSLI